MTTHAELTTPTAIEELVPGDEWGHLRTATANLEKVTFVRMQTGRYARAVVLDANGAETTVPHKQLKFPWPQRDSYLAAEKRWKAIRKATSDRTAARGADIVLEAIVPYEVALPFSFKRELGILEIRDMARLAEITMLTESDFESPETFWEGDNLYVPWPITAKVVEALFRTNPDAVGRAITEQDEKLKARESSKNGFSYEYTRFVDSQREVWRTLLVWAKSAGVEQPAVSELDQVRAVAISAIDALSVRDPFAANLMRQRFDTI